MSSRSYFPVVDDDELRCTLVRAQEMSSFVEMGTLDIGLTGKDWILENGSDVVVVQDLVYSKTSTAPARWVLVVAEDSPVHNLKDLEGKKIFTELVNFTKQLLRQREDQGGCGVLLGSNGGEDYRGFGGCHCGGDRDGEHDPGQ